MTKFCFTGTDTLNTAATRLSRNMIECNFKLVKALAGEFLCTFIFIFTICANTLNESRFSSLASGSVGGGLSMAFVSIAIIYAFGEISGAHFNPAVTIGIMAARKMHWLKGLIYIFLQLLAGIIAVGVLMGLFGTDSANILVLKPFYTTDVVAAVFMEFMLTFILVFIIFAVAVGVDTKPPVELEGEDVGDKSAQAIARLNFAPIAIGLTLGFLCFLGGNVSGGGFNPVRATAPALISLQFGNLWIYWVGALAGGVCASALHTFFFAR